MDPQDSPFKPGARCALRSGYNGDTYTEVFVDRVHKSGNFTLRGRGSQQWRPSSYRNFGPDETTRWSANKTGGSWGASRESLMLWDVNTDEEITAAQEEQRLRERLANVKKRVERLRVDDVSNSYLTALELALPPLPTEAKS